ncbi:MAG: putative Ig domain-containing protein, partial [Proteobacteria bacterium]|nr:putative Ig domain-containing protein [Pseudomonadota bacterium]
NTNTDAGRVTSCTATPLSGIALPAGLQIIALGSPGNGCVLTGTPSAITAQAAYTITVTNDNGTSTLTLDITVNPAAPVLTVPVAQTVATGDEVVLTLVNTGGNPETCTTSSTLPDGLTVGMDNSGQTCQLSGTVDQEAALQMYTVAVRAANVSGDSTAVVQITVVLAAPVLTTPGAISVGEGESLLAQTLNSSAGRPSQCVFIDLGAEEGMMEVANHHGLNARVSDNGAGCTIVGDPFGAPGEVNYILRAINDAGFSEVTITITITTSAPVFEVASQAITATAGLVLIPNVLTTTGSVPESCFFAGIDNSEIAPPAGLAVTRATPLRGCLFSGSLPDVGTYTYTVRAANSAGGDNISVEITVNPAVPSLPTGPLSYIAIDGQSINSAHIANTGGDIESGGCQFLEIVNEELTPIANQGDLPLTLTSFATGCTLSGTLTGTGTQSFIIGAQNVSGDDSVVVDFTVNPPPPSLPTMTTVGEAVDGATIAPLSIANSGGAADSCAFLDNTPAAVNTLDGLSIAVNLDGSACTITGTLTGTGQYTYTVRATNASGSDDALVTFTVSAAVPALATPAMQVYPTGEGASLELTNNGGGQLNTLSDSPPGCAVDAELPSGLALVVSADESTCTIFGTPDTVQAATNYIITATNDTGSATATANIEIVSGAPIFADAGTLVYTDGDTVNESLANSNIFGGLVSDCSAVDTLPAGLTITALVSPSNGCSLTGTVSGTAAQDTYDITATNDNGETTLTLDISVLAALPDLPTLPASAIMVEAVDGVAINTITVANTGGVADSCAFVAGMPSSPTETANLDGLSIAVNLDGSACTIDGTLTGTGEVNYTVRASNASGSDDAVVSFTVNPTAPALATPAMQVYPTGEGVSLELTNNGGGLLYSLSDLTPGCAVDATLPSGLSLAVSADENTCIIIGTPDTVQAATDYTITATNATGSATATANIEIVSGAPMFAAPGALVYTDGDTANESLANINIYGGDVTDCSAVDTLPTGLIIAALASSSNGCSITGTVSGTAAQDDYDITVSNDNGQTTLTLNITVNAAPPAVPELPDSATMVEAVDGVAINTVTVANTGAAADSCYFVTGMPS